MHVTEDERARFEAILDAGLVDTFRHLHPDATAYTWWDYRVRIFHKGPRSADRLRARDARSGGRGRAIRDGARLPSARSPRTTRLFFMQIITKTEDEHRSGWLRLEMVCKTQPSGARRVVPVGGTVEQRFESVLSAARTGAEWAWAELYREHAPVVLGYLRRAARPTPRTCSARSSCSWHAIYPVSRVTRARSARGVHGRASSAARRRPQAPSSPAGRRGARARRARRGVGDAEETRPRSFASSSSRR